MRIINVLILRYHHFQVRYLSNMYFRCIHYFCQIVVNLFKNALYTSYVFIYTLYIRYFQINCLDKINNWKDAPILRLTCDAEHHKITSRRTFNYSSLAPLRNKEADDSKPSIDSLLLNGECYFSITVNMLFSLSSLYYSLL